MFKKKGKLESEDTQEIGAVDRTKKTNRIKSGKSKKKIIRVGVIIIGILVLAIVIGKFTGNKPSAGPAVSTGTIEKMDLEQVVSIKGAIEGSDSAKIYSSANYRISKVLVEEGDRVTEGQILATLDADDLKDQYNKAALSLKESKRVYENSKALYEQGAVSKEEYLKAKAAYETDSLSVSAYNIKESSNVTSPISGTVTRVNATAGKVANGTNNNDPLFVVENIDNLQMRVKISEYDISKIKEGQTVTITAEVLGDQSVSGVVSKISPTGEQKDAASKEMVIPVVIDVDRGDTNLIAGVTAKARILIEKKEKVLTIPIDAILENPETGEKSIFVINNGIINKKIVETGLEGDLYIEVSGKDIKEGDVVVLAPTFDYVDGMPVTVEGGAGTAESGAGTAQSGATASVTTAN